MSLFSGSKTLEARVQQLESDLVTATQTNTDLTASRDTASARVTDLESQVATLTTEAAATRTAAEQSLADATQASAVLVTQLTTSLSLTPEQASAITPAIITASIEQIVQSRAVTLAASQGVPPLPTDPSAASADQDEIKISYELAAAETDPMKKAQLFARASKLVEQKSNSKHN